MRLPKGLIFILVPALGCGSTPEISEPPPDEVDRIIGEAMMGDRGIPAASVLVIKDGKVLKQKVYGKASLDPPIAADLRTVFPIFSTIKVFTAAGVLRLVDQGKLSLDDPLGKFLPNQPGTWRDITVRQLLSHTSGLPDLIDTSDEWKYLSEDREDALKLVASRPLASKPGVVCAYQQTGYVLIGKIVEKVTGKPFARYMTEDVFLPLGDDLNNLWESTE